MMRPLTETSNRKARSYDQNLLITYDCETGEFTYPSQNEFRPIGQFLHEEGYASESTAEHLNGKIKELAAWAGLTPVKKVPYADYLQVID